MRPHDFGPISKINFGELLPPNKEDWKFFHYKGSLTSPPCADIVNWIVFAEPLPISLEDLRHFKSAWVDKLGYDNFRNC